MLDIHWTEMFPLTDGCAVLGSDGNLPWPLSKVMLAVVHYGPVVVRNAKTVNISVAVFSKVVFVFLIVREKKLESNVNIEILLAHLFLSSSFLIKEKGTIYIINNDVLIDKAECIFALLSYIITRGIFTNIFALLECSSRVLI